MKDIQTDAGLASDLTQELETNKKHWYCFSYIGRTIDGDRQANGCTYTGYERQEITFVDIQENKTSAGLKQDAVLVGLMYCGLMTIEQFNDGF